MPHVFPCTAKNARRIIEGGALIKPHINMPRINVDVCKSRIANTCNRASVVDKLPNVSATLP